MAFEDALPCFRAVARLVSENRALFLSLSLSLSLSLPVSSERSLVHFEMRAGILNIYATLIPRTLREL